MRSLGPSYRRLLTAFTISNVGNGVLIAALPLLVVSGTRNPLAISGLMVAAGLPWLLIGPFSGAIVDRVDRRRAMYLAEAARAVVLGAAAVYVFGGGDSIVALYALLIVVGVGETFFDAAGLALVPALVTPAELDTANGRLFSTQTLAQRFLGPPLGGWLFAFATWVPLGVDAVSFLVAAVVVLWLPKGNSRDVPQDRGRGLPAETIEGLRWVWHDSVLRALVIGSGVLHFATGAGLSVLVLVAQDRYQLTGFGFGLTISALALGYMLGYLAAPAVATRFPPGENVCDRVGRCVTWPPDGGGIDHRPGGRAGTGPGRGFRSSVGCRLILLSPGRGAGPDSRTGHGGIPVRRPRSDATRCFPGRIGGYMGGGRVYIRCRGPVHAGSRSLPVGCLEGHRA